MKKCKKYLLLNEEGKIFCYLNQRGKLNFPTISDVTFKDSFGSKILATINGEDEFLGSYISLNNKFESVNGKLKKVGEKQKDYYVMRVYFSEEDIKNILDLCEEYCMVPEFLSIEEIKTFINNSYEKDNLIDSNAKQVMNQLVKKLNYIEY